MMKMILLGVLVSLLMTQVVWADQSPEPFAVVELFTSEGCSSCPSADDLLRQLSEESKVTGKRVYFLSFQVDYWNNLGWTDPFSQALFTQRQHQYANILGASSVYTPQMIVNGEASFVGSDANKAHQYIEQYLQEDSKQTLTLDVDNTDAEQIRVTYQTDVITPNMVINIALVENGLESQVTAGENQGRLLKHNGIVREFKTMPLLANNGNFVFSKKSVSILNKSAIIAYVQDVRNMKICTARHFDLM